MLRHSAKCLCKELHHQSINYRLVAHKRSSSSITILASWVVIASEVVFIDLAFNTKFNGKFIPLKTEKIKQIFNNVAVQVADIKNTLKVNRR